MHEEHLQNFTVLETHEEIRGIQATRDGKEVMSEYLGTDVAAGASGIRWWDTAANRQGLAFYGCVVQHTGNGDKVFKPDEVAFGEVASELAPFPLPEPEPLNALNGDGVVDFSGFNDAKCDGYAVFHEIAGYPADADLGEKIRYLDVVENGTSEEDAIKNTPVVPDPPEVVLNVRDMKGPELDQWARDHEVPDYDFDARVPVRRKFLGEFIEQTS